MLKEMGLVSLILPIYNVEKYINECLQSISKQSYKNIEVILVNDGSTDESRNYAENFIKRDARFKLIDQSNAGSGPARNEGIKNASGEYIIFIDPDDWIDESYVETLVEAAQVGADLVLSGSVDFVYDAGRVTKEKFNIPLKEKLTGYNEVRQAYLRLFKNELVTSPTKKLYRRDIIEINSLEFPGLRRSQDIVFNYRYFDCVQSIVILNYAGYHYRMIPTERILKLKEDYYKTVNFIIDDIRKLHKKWGVENREQQIECTFLYMYVANMEADIIGNRSLNGIISDRFVKDVFKSAKKVKFYYRIIRKAVLANKPGFISILVRGKFVIKRILAVKLQNQRKIHREGG